MIPDNIAGQKNIDEFVAWKLSAFEKTEHTFRGLFGLMFSEETNIMYEQSRGYRIEKTTYGEAKKVCLQKAATVKKLFCGCPYDSIIGLFMDNSLDWIENFWAILAAGFRPLLLNLRLDTETLETVLKEVGAIAVITGSRNFSVRTVKAEEIIPDGEEENGTFGTELFCMSSGTSMHVKVCAYSAEEFYYQIMDSGKLIRESSAAKQHYKGQLKQLTFLPFYHIFGLVAMYIWFGFFSRTFVQLNDLSAQTLLNTIRRHEVTHIFAVPLFWEQVYSQAVREIRGRGEKTWKKFEKGLALSDKIGDVPGIGRMFTRLAFKEVRDGLFGESISFMIVGGGAVKPEVLRFFNAIGYPLSDGYGMTEIGITSVELSPKKKILNTCSVGKPFSSVEYRINDGGELEVRGRSLAKYVWEDGKKTSHTEEWFNTHDLAKFENGRYYILGRKDDLVVSASGENLNPCLIEPKLDVPGTEGAVLLNGKEAGQPVLIISVSKYLTEESLHKIQTDVKERLRTLNLAGQISHVFYTKDALIVGDEFKLNRIRLRREYLDGTMSDAEVREESADPEEDDPIDRRIKQFFAAALNLKISDIRKNKDFFTDYGGTSLDYFAMVSEMQSEFGITFPAEEERSLSSAGEIAAFVREHM